MKTFIKILMVALCIFITTGNLSAQNYTPLKYSPELLLGKWTATSGNMTYEVEFTTQILTYNRSTEYILGKITFKNNNTTIRKTQYNRLSSIIYGGMESPKKADLDFCDEERLVWWKFDFIIDENDSNQAVWKFIRADEGLPGMRWNKENLPDIPDNLVFRKVVIPTNPGGLDPGNKM